MSMGELLPEGVRDYLDEEVRRHRFVEGQLAGVFEQWGYVEVMTPCFEFYEQLETGIGRRVLENAYKFCDNRGRILALRPEMTTPIARVAATSLANEGGPLRLYYLANIFQVQQAGGGRLHEYYQAGGEILGVPGVQADAEIIALAIQCLSQIGLSQFKVGIGQVAFLKSVLADANLSDSQRDQVIACLQERNLVGLEKTLKDCNLDPKQRDFLWNILTKNGNGGSQTVVKELLNQVGPQAQAQLAQLEELFATLAAYGVLEHVYLDLGIVRDLDYYTGVIFEVYGPGLGRPLGGGGRYDKLMANFGRELPATGFALGFPEILALCQRQNIAPPPPGRDYLVVPSEKSLPQALERCRELRQEGHTVELELNPISREKSLSYGKQRGFTQVLFVGPDGVESVVTGKKPKTRMNRILPFCGIH